MSTSNEGYERMERLVMPDIEPALRAQLVASGIPEHEARVLLALAGEMGKNMRLRTENERLRAEIEELKVQDIVARNPGIDPKDVRAFRGARGTEGTIDDND